jgi:phosphoserine aminotransferase
MISFYPGPSRVHDEIPEYVKDAYRAGFLSINHRSNEFMEMSENVIRSLKSRLEIPADYTVFYTTSATECWEIIAQSLITGSSYHLYNGAFGKKWYEYTHRLRSGAKSHPFEYNELVDPKKMRFSREDSVICLTQNETSNGTQVSNDIIRALRERYPSHLIAVDATSSMAGIYLDFQAADVWFASVQKCFGLPAGLGLMVCSPAAIQKAERVAENNHYNSISFMAEMMKKWQTPFTPNVLNIYLLGRVLEASKPIRRVHEKIAERYRSWDELLKGKETIRHLVDNEAARSLTVIPVSAKEALVTAIKSRAKKSGLLLGEGYGELKSSTFRIANFPAIRKSEIKVLKGFLSEYS